VFLRFAPDKAQVRVKNGILTVTITKPPEVQKATKKIEIKGEKQPHDNKKAA
jgi:HSP20 family molecular chaperone IbpA